MIMNSIIILIFGRRLVLRAVKEILVVTTHQKVVWSHFRTYWFDMNFGKAILVGATAALVGLSHLRVLDNLSRNRYLIDGILRDTLSMIIVKEIWVSVFLLENATKVVVCKIANLYIL